LTNVAASAVAALSTSRSVSVASKYWISGSSGASSRDASNIASAVSNSGVISVGLPAGYNASQGLSV
jgi:hypothetical protein